MEAIDRERVAEEPRELDAGGLARELSRAIVGLYKEYVGRGPTNARTYIQDDLIAVVLEGTMVRAEETLAEEGEEDLVRGVRRVLQGKFRTDAVEIVEELSGREVKAFVSDHDIKEDVALEAFVLHAAAPEETSG